MLPDRYETDARCRVLWGETQEAVDEWLVFTGADEKESMALFFPTIERGEISEGI